MRICHFIILQRGFFSAPSVLHFGRRALIVIFACEDRRPVRQKHFSPMRIHGLCFVRLYVWFCRFRHRRGYGVHSPWAFQFITGVIYERAHYYAYDDLALSAPPCNGGPSVKVERLLLRLANFVQPAHVVVEGSRLGQSAGYLQAGCRRAVVLCGTEPEISQCRPWPIDMLYTAPDADFYDSYLRHASSAAPHSLFILSGIHRNREALRRWRSVCADSRSGITFDLYDVGLVFFDHTRNKQHYIVNF